VDLKSLQDVQILTQARKKRRMEQVDKFFSAALEQVNFYTETADVSLLQDSLQRLSETLKLSSTHAESYYLMAYVFYLLDMLPEAKNYLETALSFKPTLILAQDLQRHLQRGEFPPLQFPGPDQKDLDLDELYDRVEIRIQIKVHEIICMEIPAQPSPQSCIRNKLSEMGQSLEEEYRYLNQQLQKIDQEIDIGELKIKLRPFEIRLHQVKQLFQQSQQLFEILKRLQVEIEQVQAELDFPRASHLETILDHCDLLADQLDELVNQKIPISELEPTYQELVEHVNQLQELLEEAAVV